MSYNKNTSCCAKNGGSIPPTTPYGQAVKRYDGINPKKYANNTSLSGFPDNMLGCWYCGSQEAFGNIDWDKNALRVRDQSNYELLKVDNIVLIVILLVLLISRSISDDKISDGLVSLAIIVILIIVGYKTFGSQSN
jgi:hypothetical protein